jgi:hypothetical protein
MVGAASADQRRRAGVRARSAGESRQSEIARAPEVSAVRQLPIREHIFQRLHRRPRDLVRHRKIEHLLLRPLREPTTDEGVELIGVTLLIHLPVRVFRVAAPRRVAHHLEAARPFAPDKTDEVDLAVLTRKDRVRIAAPGKPSTGTFCDAALEHELEQADCGLDGRPGIDTGDFDELSLPIAPRRA